ncbi:hypothetical protein HS048_07735 [Planomonospora sp. ID91781]|uniref:hypothetical protein n=1 Tax=Planomonospora sp. ID91781 TaxID=2738135 RepID=UPI0018C39940|nr:hypothetical protein [Planomonospora sp. ID91781]MBG0820622.1 hypothetical protein [Planomonospora sp. ID91781]
MNRTSKTTRVLLVAAFAVCLSACAGEGGSDPSAAPAAPSASESAPSASASAPEAASPDGSTPEPSGEATETSPPFHATSAPSAPPSPEGSGGRGLDEDVLGQVTMKGADSILVTGDDSGDRTAELVPFTEVLDVQGGICDEGPVPHRCSVDQLKKALKGDVSLYAKVTIKDGLVVKIEELVRN